MSANRISVTINAGALIFSAPGCAPFKFDPADASQQNRIYAELHGWKQRLSDTAAMPAGTSIRERFAAIVDLGKYYMQGDVPWSRRAQGSGEASTNSRTFRALLAVTKLGEEELRERLESQAKKANVTVQKYLAVLRTKAGPVKDEYDRLAAIEEADEITSAEDFLSGIIG